MLPRAPKSAALPKLKQSPSNSKSGEFPGRKNYGRLIETVSPALDALVTLTVMPSTVTLSPTARGACKYRGSVNTELG